LDLHFLVPHTFYGDDLFDKILDEVDGLREVAIDKIEQVIAKPNAIKRKLTSLKDMRQYGLQYALNKDDNVGKEDDTENSSILDVNPDSGIVMLWSVNLKDLKASVPLVTETLTYMSNALIRPVVGYMNANKTSIKLNLSAKMDKVNDI
jgi:mitochondrial distribution and morphology protein 31